MTPSDKEIHFQQTVFANGVLKRLYTCKDERIASAFVEYWKEKGGAVYYQYLPNQWRIIL